MRDEYVRGEPLLLLPNGANHAMLLGTGCLPQSLLRSSALADRENAAGIIVINGPAQVPVMREQQCERGLQFNRVK